MCLIWSTQQRHSGSRAHGKTTPFMIYTILSVRIDPLLHLEENCRLSSQCKLGGDDLFIVEQMK